MLITSELTIACLVPKPGYGEDHKTLIANAKTIALVRLQRQEKPSYGGVLYTLETVEVLKGKAAPTYEFRSIAAPGSVNDFDAHQASTFWDTNVGRSEWPCCICGPDHAFDERHVYLYFPEKLGAVKSAEIVSTPGDRWLKYVRETLNGTKIR